MKKRVGTVAALLAVTGWVHSATLQEWTFYADPFGTVLSNAYNSAGSAEFALTSGFDDASVFADGAGALLCLHDDDNSTTGLWTNGAVLTADTGGSVSAGVRYLRYDFSYDLSDIGALNDSGCLVGFSFYDSSGDKVAGVALKYDVALATSTPYQVTELTELTNTAGSVAVLARVDLGEQTLDVWYDLSGDVSGFSSNAPMTTITNLTLTSFDALQFQATGDIQPPGSTDQVTVGLLRMTDSFEDAVELENTEVENSHAVNEWTFERDVNGRTLSGTINIGTNRPLAQFAAGGPDCAVRNRALYCTGEASGTGGHWTDGVILDASLPVSTSGVHYLRYDVDYSLTNSLNDSGTLLGVYFTGNGSNQAAGIVLNNESNQLIVAAYTENAVTVLTNSSSRSGTLTVITEVNLSVTPATLKAWYSLDGSNPTNYNAEAFQQDLSLTNIANLRFHATGDFQPAGSDDYAAVENIRHTMDDTTNSTAWSEIIGIVVDLTPPPLLSFSVSNNLSGAMDLGETNVVSVVISNAVGAGPASQVTSTLSNDISATAFLIIPNNAPVNLAAGESVTNTYELIAQEQGNYTVYVVVHSAETNTAASTFSLAAGANLTILSPDILDSGGDYTGLYEPGETLEITVTTTNDGAKTVFNITNTLAVPAGFTITSSASDRYASIAAGAVTSTVYTVEVGTEVTAGTYTFYVTNQTAANTWADSLDVDVFVRVSGTDWIKADNNLDLTNRSSWVDTVVPDATDRAILDDTVSFEITTELGKDLTWRGIALVSNTAAWTINGSNSLMLGSAGIDMGQAGAALTITAGLNLVASQTWSIVTGQTLTVSGALSGEDDAPVVATGGGTLDLRGTNTFSGGLVLSNGILSVGSDTALGSAAAVFGDAEIRASTAAELRNDIELAADTVFNNDSDLALDGIVSGDGRLTKTGGGTLVLNSENTYSGGTVISTNATVQVGHAGGLGIAPVVMEAGAVLTAPPGALGLASSVNNNIQLNGEAGLQTDTSNADLMVIDGDISGFGSLEVVGYQFYLRGHNTFSGGLKLSHNNWLCFNADSLGSGPLETTRTAYLLALEDAEITNSVVMDNTFRMHNAGYTVTLSGPMNGGGRLQCIDNNNGTIIISGDNIGRTGDTQLRRPAIRLGHKNALGSGDVWLEPQSSSFQIEVSHNFSGADRLMNDFLINNTYGDVNTGESYPVTFDLDYDLEIGGRFYSTVSDMPGIEKRGSGRLILSGSNEYLDPVDVDEGTLVISNTTFNSEQVSVASGAELDLQMTPVFAGDLTITSGGQLSLHIRDDNPVLSGAVDLSLDGAMTLDFSGYSGANSPISAGDTFAVIDSNWLAVTNQGVQVLADGLPSFLTVDDSSLFVDGTVAIVASRLSDQSLTITVPAGMTGTGTVALTNDTGGMLDFTLVNDGSWPVDGDYSVEQQSAYRTPFGSSFIETGTVFNVWNGDSTAVKKIGFDFGVFGTTYTSFSVSRLGKVLLSNAQGETAALKTYASADGVEPSTVRYRQTSTNLVVAWGNGTGQEFQARLSIGGAIRYLYQYGSWSGGVIGVQNSDYTQTISHLPGTTTRDSILLSSGSWVSNDPEAATVAGGSFRTVTFTVDATNQGPGETPFIAAVHWGDNAVDSLFVNIIVTGQSLELAVPSPFNFSGPVFTKAVMTVTNTGDADLTFTVTDRSLQNAGYDFSATTFQWNSIPVSSPFILSESDLGTRAVGIGFPFTYFGNTYSTVTVNENGSLSLGSQSIITPFAANLSYDDNSSIRALTDAAGETFTVIWQNMSQPDGGANQTFQTALNRDGTIRFNYDWIDGVWYEGIIQLADPAGTVLGTLSNSTTYVSETNITPQTVTVTNWFGGAPLVEQTTVYTTNVTGGYVDTIIDQSLSFTPGTDQIITVSPQTAVVEAGQTAQIQVFGDARSAGTGVYSNTLSFGYAGADTSSVVRFTATDGAINPEDLWGGDPAVFSVRNSDGSHGLSWPVPPDWQTRTYVIWYTTRLDGEWSELARVTNDYQYIDTEHMDEPVIFYKVSVE